MRLGLNVFAGLAGSAWTALVTLAVVPFYLRYLGVEAYGLIGFFVTLQVMLQLLDGGLAAATNREVTRHASAVIRVKRESLAPHRRSHLLGMAAIVGLLVVATAQLIASHRKLPRWCKPEQIPHHEREIRH